ncbi:hypothetical protein CEXT_523801 [Caerostris extrusa]|uniref:Uncharacterized protein n=1 Tax=Caerostris extrusa TaxID=172846 RepID=A0AAV4T4H4_CAEEX|nr:hypothetical protein CEXT_523801 [Caerostris extrusa]
MKRPKVSEMKRPKVSETKRPKILEIKRFKILEIKRPKILEIKRFKILEIKRPKILEIKRLKILEIKARISDRGQEDHCPLHRWTTFGHREGHLLDTVQESARPIQAQAVQHNGHRNTPQASRRQEMDERSP